MRTSTSGRLPTSPIDRREVLAAVDQVTVAHDREGSLLEGNLGLADPGDELLGPGQISHQVADRHDRESVKGGESEELRQSHHLAVRGRDLADDGGFPGPGQDRQVDRCLGVAGALEYARRPDRRAGRRGPAA